VDDLCDSFDPMVTRTGNELHDGWVHSHPVGDSAGRSGDQHHRRSPAGSLSSGANDPVKYRMRARDPRKDREQEFN
jgi:hypothetical protein